MTGLPYGMEAWRNIRSVEVKEIEKIQGKALKVCFNFLFQHLILVYKSRIAKMQYAIMMLYHNIRNSDDNKKVKQVIKEQEENQYKNNFNQKVKKNCKRSTNWY